MKLTDVHNIDDEIMDNIQNIVKLPFLLPATNSSNQEKWEKSYGSLKRNLKELNMNSNIYDPDGTKKNHIPNNKLKWALVTGASRGIGRAIAVELARAKVPVILVARDFKRLQELSKHLNDCYGVPAVVIISDLSAPGAAQKLYDETYKTANLTVDFLICNAGVSDTTNIVESRNTDRLAYINMISFTNLCTLYGSEMKDRKRGRILIISSIMGAVPGVPRCGVYAATKAYQRSLATTLRRELETYGVGVSCILPGGVRDTNFASAANMTDSLLWKVPFGQLTAEIVAKSAVNAMLKGHQEIVVGWVNVIFVLVATKLISPRLSMILCEIVTAPPFIVLKKSISSKKGPPRDVDK
eukprot:CAMPEP_0194107532 /NCGR_PEP_ID=MMETSP0150-20130528/7398_1 /TAXON_ID=122233 /ORGANISM="Chaetoceros debilis, Strain MM31A-1" /LENGTH=354 /DNA_ID=CAMNT_0038795973 /DNA_START=256 /DNA_END=1320 /DNA_ORIENTATION=-